MSMASSSKHEHEAATGLSLSMRMAVYGITKKFPSVRSVSCSQFNQWMRDDSKKVVCLDTRPKEEYDISHISGAVQADPKEDHTLESLGITSDSTVVCYCSVGYRSSNLAKTLYSKHKLSTPSDSPEPQKLDIYNLEGGLFQWATEGREMVGSSGELARTVHPYSSFWGKLLDYDLRHNL